MKHRTLLRNGITLGLSLIFTSFLGLFVRVMFPSALGPESYGVMRFVESVVECVFILTSFGIDTYIRKSDLDARQVPDYLWPTLIIRVVLSILAISAIAVTYALRGATLSFQWMLVIYAASQVFYSSNQTLSAVIHNSLDIKYLSYVNVINKALWALLSIYALIYAPSIGLLALIILVTEFAKCAYLMWYLMSYFNFQKNGSLSAALGALKKSSPLYLNQIALLINARLGVSILGFTATPKEVGWYAAANTLSMVLLMFTPLIGWVLLPTGSKAYSKNRDELNRLMRNAFFWIVSIATPLSLILFLEADLWILSLFGPEFKEAIPAFKTLSFLFILTYAATLLSTYLMQTHQDWLLTKISVAMLTVSVILHALLVPSMANVHGEGGAGLGASLALLLTETLTIVTLFYYAGRQLFEKLPFLQFLQLGSIALIVVVLHKLLKAPHLLAIPFLMTSFFTLLFTTRFLHFPTFLALVKTIWIKKNLRTL